MTFSVFDLPTETEKEKERKRKPIFLFSLLTPMGPGYRNIPDPKVTK